MVQGSALRRAVCAALALALVACSSAGSPAAAPTVASTASPPTTTAASPTAATAPSPAGAGTGVQTTTAPGAPTSAAAAKPPGTTTAAGAATGTSAGAASPAAGATGASNTASATAGGEATPKIVAAANALVATLNATQKQAAIFDFNDTQNKAAWSNLPQQLFKWAGVRMGDLSADQQNLVRDLLKATLSAKGYQRVMDSVAADEYLKSQSGNNPLQFGADNYHVAVFGTPSTTAPWMFRFGGHHVTVNATIAGPNIALTPSFPGCQPCSFSQNNQTVVPDAEQVDKAFKLIGALDATQQKQAVVGVQSIDLVWGPQDTQKTVVPEGIKASALNAQQQAMLWDLVSVYTGILNDAGAAQKMAEVKANADNTYFAWYGATAGGGVAYYRIQGPSLWIEFAPQGGGGGPGGGPGGAPPGGAAQPGLGIGGAAAMTHVHAIYRDPTNEYGKKWAS